MKQIIVIRDDLNMRKGKLIAQGCHASVNAIINVTEDSKVTEWLSSGSKKVCLRVPSEEELLSIYHKALNSGLLCSLVKDAGLTEFKQPTLTAVAIGPDLDSKIDPITGKLRLL